ncbi:phage integrase SAM-like domain-containing protein [uncultured Parabacteroides sp.]|uniref:tyrosine-type recombinase/integrase n=1 Tax=uncultured Parabacteroides sp. TaxID=512312 RepID=UPI0026597321|nr:phage integrase SAM-like domain-containing protein [uncultured Parabacteroides sp.]
MQQPILFHVFASEYLSICKKSDAYKKSLQNAVNHLLRFSDNREIPIFTNMNEQVMEDFVYYLQRQNLMVSTVKNNINRIKYLLRKAHRSGYETDRTIEDFPVPDEESNAIFLTMREVYKIHRYANLTDREIEIKDYFIIGCLTALRFSDYSRLKPKNFVRNKIVIKTKKTNTPVQVPMHPVVKEIVQKYNKELPPPPSVQHFNRQIKKICKKIGFKRKVLFERQVGQIQVSRLIPKYQFISSHTARRTAATNMYLAGIMPFRIMLVTGHKTEKAFFRYIRITREENVKVLARHRFFTCRK